MNNYRVFELGCIKNIYSFEAIRTQTFKIVIFDDINLK
jgi:hypothetical protein